jgi:hypothetical protein
MADTISLARAAPLPKPSCGNLSIPTPRWTAQLHDALLACSQTLAYTTLPWPVHVQARPKSMACTSNLLSLASQPIIGASSTKTCFMTNSQQQRKCIASKHSQSCRICILTPGQPRGRSGQGQRRPGLWWWSPSHHAPCGQSRGRSGPSCDAQTDSRACTIRYCHILLKVPGVIGCAFMP